MKGSITDHAPSNGGAVPTNAGTSAVVSLANPFSAGEEIMQRGVSERTTIYTPNELFYTFNKPTGAEDTPWQLQTDENGGFIIQWAPTLTNGQHNYKSFYISKALSDSLGLNNYMEHIGSPPSSDKTEYFVPIYSAHFCSSSRVKSAIVNRGLVFNQSILERYT